MHTSERRERGRLIAALLPNDSGRVLPVFLTASVFLLGLYPYWCALLAGAFLAASLFHSVRKKQSLSFPLSLPSVTVCVAVFFYLIVVCWAVDRGMAFLGFLTYLPAVLLIILAATTCTDRERLLRSLARAGGFSVAVCMALCAIPDLREAFFPGGRFSGPFQYANAYGLFLLASIVILCKKKPLPKSDYVLCALSALGVFLTGSRSLFVLAIAVLALLAFINWRFALFSAAGAGVAVLLASLFAMTGALQRSGDISLTTGEWLTRLAYYRDGLSLIGERPFGLGHSGWWYMQPVIQTSVYDARLIHSWLLQTALDIGVIPALLLAAGAVALFFHKGHGFREKLLIALVLGHGMIDFDLAYLPVVFILVLLLPYGRTIKLDVTRSRKIIPLAMCVVAAGVSLWLGTASFLSSIGLDKAAAALYPSYTEAMEKVIVTEPDPAEAFIWADRILNLNRYVFDAYDVKARVYADNGEWMDAVAMKTEFLSISRLQGRDYDELLMYIHFAIQEAAKAGDVAICRKLADQALGIPGILDELSDSLSPLAYRIKQQPTLVLSDDSTRFLEYLKEFRATLGG